MADVADLAGTLHTAAAVAVGGFTDVRVVGRQRSAGRSDVVACHSVVAWQTRHCR